MLASADIEGAFREAPEAVTRLFCVTLWRSFDPLQGVDGSWKTPFGRPRLAGETVRDFMLEQREAPTVMGPPC